MTGRRLKLAVVVTHPIQYHACRWRALAAQPDLDVTVLYCRKGSADGSFSEAFQRHVAWDVPLLDGYRHKTFRNWSTGTPLNPGIWGEIARGGYDAVYLHGTNYPTHIGAALIGRLLGKKVLIFSVCYDLDQRAGAKGLLRNGFYRAVYRMADRVLNIGTHSGRHYRAAGVPARKLVPTPHVVDNQFFADTAARLTRAEAKARFGIPKRARVLLFCAKMFAKKRPDLLLNAFIEADLEGWVLLMVGDGVDRPALMAEAARRAAGRVFFPGFLNQTEIGAAYQAADVHVLPSKEKETWGLVVNESLNFGCAQIVSDMVGCAPDLVAGRTGEVFPSGDKGALMAVLRTLNTAPEKWRRYGAAAPTVLKTYSVDRYVAGVPEALGLPVVAGAAARRSPALAAA